MPRTRASKAAAVRKNNQQPTTNRAQKNQNEERKDEFEEEGDEDPIESVHIKRTAETSPDGKPLKKRTAFVDLTNAKNKANVEGNKKVAVVKPTKKTNKSVEVARKAQQVPDRRISPDVSTSEDSSINQSDTYYDVESDKSGNSSCYATPDDVLTSSKPGQKRPSTRSQGLIVDSSLAERNDDANAVPEGVEDFDKENWLDPFSASEYAMDIFQYFKERERKFAVRKYMTDQREISRSMRGILVDWMVEVQESFELNHETLYMGVKLVDLYLQRRVVGKETLQLLGATAVFITSKFEERNPPVIEDFLYICDDAYSRKELLAMEANVLRTIDFDIGFPLSYSYLRRYARCGKITMELLTLARYILETSLLDYDLVDESESLLAASSLLLANKMSNIHVWSKTLEYYTGYKVEDLKDLVNRLNTFLSQPVGKGLKTVHSKYSHKVFFEVAKIPILAKIDWDETS